MCACVAGAVWRATYSFDFSFFFFLHLNERFISNVFIVSCVCFYLNLKATSVVRACFAHTTAKQKRKNKNN